ncbi:NAD(P)-binding Rossmann-fold containing protein [Apiospora phragmitis]|uniref:NAD(P)-binding Rossmann-fold containing protein n=1 Tax=Apiospora phragmitis TaxID=2905665 RepID=A0ABR1WTU3_9PEZI
MRSLAGARAIVTGGSRGIGLAIAKHFAAEGASITLVGRDEARLQTALQSLALRPDLAPPAAAPPRHDTYAFDVADQSGWHRLMEGMKPNNQKVDVLVNAAGVSQNSLLYRTGAPDVKEILGTNLVGTINGCQVVIKSMMQQKSGCIVNVSSLLATHAGRGASVYAASKAGIVGLTRALAWEVGRFGIRINVILPGYIQTEMTASVAKSVNLESLIPLGRLGSAEEVADAAAFLVKNPYAHNTVLNLDGGLSAT